MATAEFQKQLTDVMPKMRLWALAMSRNSAAADDLVQETAVRALKSHESFAPGTNLSAWLRRIMYNHFVSEIRSNRRLTSSEELPEMAMRAMQQNRVDIRELNREMERLPKEQQAAIRLIALEDLSYDEVSAITGAAIGTLKSRVHRGRQTLRDRFEQLAA
jgi:RNA polymerase sigma-70 factor, ECF subfamily